MSALPTHSLTLFITFYFIGWHKSWCGENIWACFCLS